MNKDNERGDGGYREERDTDRERHTERRREYFGLSKKVSNFSATL